MEKPCRKRERVWLLLRQTPLPQELPYGECVLEAQGPLKVPPRKTPFE